MKSFSQFTSTHASGQRFLSDPSTENHNCLALAHLIRSVAKYHDAVSRLVDSLEAAGITSDTIDWSAVEELLDGLISITDEKGFKPVFSYRKQELSELLEGIVEQVYLLEMQLLYTHLKDIELE
jgi:tRNA nucleotidyltransferase (CCA-adding enzyme)